MSHLVFPILWGVGLLVFAGIMAARMRLLVAARPAARLDRIPERIRRTVVYGLGQKKFLVGEQPSGIMHALVFWGFVVLLLQVITLFGRAFDADWSIPGFAADEPLGPPFFLARDLLEAFVIVAVTYMLYRRLVLHAPRLFGLGRAEQRYREAPHWEGILILVLILLIVVGGMLYDAGRLVADDIHGNERDFAPLAALVAAALDGLSASTASTVSEVGWWLHNVTVLVFLCLLPLSKHFHVITAIPNVFFAKLPPRGPERPLAITHVPAAPVAALDGPPEGLVGVASLADLSWKQVLDSFTCTECGRCTAVCPATAAGTPLAPRQVILDIRDRLYQHPEEQRNGDGSPEPLISEEALWACTTCMACVEACPVGIEHVPTIVDMRRNLVDQGELDPLLQQTLAELRQAGQLLRQVGAHAGPLGQGPRLQDPGRAQGAGRVPLVRRRLRLLRRAGAARLAERGADPARRRRLVRAALRGRAQLGQRRAQDRRGGPVRDAGRAEHGRARRRGVRGDLHHRPALAQRPAQRVPAVRARQAGLPLHRAARRPRRAGRDLAAHPALRDARHLPRPLLPGPLQPDHRGAAEADRGDRRRARGDAAQRDEHVLLRRRRRPDLDDGRGGDRASGRASSESARRRRWASSTTSSSAARRTWRCTRTRPRSSAPTSRSRS